MTVVYKPTFSTVILLVLELLTMDMCLILYCVLNMMTDVLLKWRQIFWAGEDGHLKLYLLRNKTANINDKLECGSMPNVMAAVPNIGGALCLMPLSLADAHY